MLISFGCSEQNGRNDFLDEGTYRYSTNVVLKKNTEGDYILEGEIKELLAGVSKESVAITMGMHEFPVDQRTDENAQLWVIPALIIGDEVTSSSQDSIFGFVSGESPVLCKLPVEGKVKIEMPLDSFVSQRESLRSFLSREGSTTGRLLLLGPSGKSLSKCQSKSFVLKIDNSKGGKGKSQSLSLGKN